MKAAVMYKPSVPLEIVDLNIENPKAGEVLVKMDATGLCASDHHVIEGVLPWSLGRRWRSRPRRY